MTKNKPPNNPIMEYIRTACAFLILFIFGMAVVLMDKQNMLVFITKLFGVYAVCTAALLMLKKL